jgi:hypothetical protein
MDYETVLPIISRPEKTVNDVMKEIQESNEPCGCGHCSCGGNV